MYLASAVLTGALALQASAFLVPLEISKAAEQAKSELASLLAKTGHTVDLDCPGCPFFGIEDTTELQYDVENKIHLELNIDDQQTLTINGLPVMPEIPAAPFVPVMAPQIRVEDGEQTAPIQLDYAYERLSPVVSAEEPDKSILPVRLTILGLHGQPVKVDALAIDLLQTPDQTSIARISTVPFEDTPGAKTCDESSKWSLCRLRAILAARFQTLMEAAKARAHAAKGWANGKGCKGKKFGEKGKHHGHGHHMGKHHHHHHHHRLHRVAHVLYQTLRFFVIPILVGVIFALMARAIGLLVGQFISYLWVKYRRNSHRRHETSTVKEEDCMADVSVEQIEKERLLAEDDIPPPQYEDVEANVQEVHDDEKH